MSEKSNSVSVTLSHQGRSVKHNTEIAKIVKEIAPLEIVEQRNEWLQPIRSFIDSSENKHIVSTVLSFDGGSYSEIIRLFPPYLTKPEVVFCMFTHGSSELEGMQSLVDYSVCRRSIDTFVPSADFKLTKEHHYELTDTLRGILDAAKKRKMRLKHHESGDIRAPGMSFTISNHRFDPKEVKFSVIVAPTVTAKVLRG